MGAAILSGGAVENAAMASWGTFIGALCFFTASAMVLPGAGTAEAVEQPDPSLVVVEDA